MLSNEGTGSTGAGAGGLVAWEVWDGVEGSDCVWGKCVIEGALE